jgi:DNA-binding transcriptional LysR family regulator
MSRSARHHWPGPAGEIGVEEFVIVAAADTDLPTDPPRVRLADLADHDWVHFTAQSGLAGILDAACEAAGFSRGCRCGPSRARPR